MKACYLVLLASVIATVAAKKEGKRRDNNIICGSNGVKYETECDFYTAVKDSCETDNFLYRLPGKTCKKNKSLKEDKKSKRKGLKLRNKLDGEVCANDGNTYQQCPFMAEKYCRKLKIVHSGKCGKCTKENVCDRNNEDKIGKGKKEKKLRKRSQVSNTKVCTADREFTSKCEYLIAKCQLFAEKKEILETTVCKSP